jgi:hypothetical protein
MSVWDSQRPGIDLLTKAQVAMGTLLEEIKIAAQTLLEKTGAVPIEMERVDQLKKRFNAIMDP